MRSSLRLRVSIVALGVVAGCGQPKTTSEVDAGQPPAIDAGGVFDAGTAIRDAGPDDVDAGHGCGAGDLNLVGKEPTLPSTICSTLTATKATPDETALDTTAIQSALTACRGRGAVKLVADGPNGAFISGPLTVSSEVLWLDTGVTLYASRTASLYDKGGLPCGAEGVDQDNAATSGTHCLPLLTLSGVGPGVVGSGTINGQGGEPIVGNAMNHSWWDLSALLRASGGSAPNPALLETSGAVSNLVLYGITVVDSPKFHLKFGSTGFTVWGITILTPSTLTNSLGAALSPDTSRNTDGLDPGSGSAATNGIIACNTISTGDDQIALKGSIGVSHVIIAHNHFGSGHGMSIGSETNGGVSDVKVYDLTIDADSRQDSPGSSNSNGLRIKSDASRGGPVTNISYEDICTRDLVNPITFNAHYSSSSGTLIPSFSEISVRRLHAVRSASSTVKPVVTFAGYDGAHLATGTIDDVVVDGITRVIATNARFSAGAGGANFDPLDGGLGVGNPSAPECLFPVLPVPK